MLLPIRWLFLALLCFSPLAKAQFFLVSEGNSFVDNVAKQKIIGIEIEFKNLSDTTITDVIKRYYPEAVVSGNVATGINFDTNIGLIKLVIEGQAYKYESDPVKFKQQQAIDLVEAPREIVFPPVRFMDETSRIQALFQDLKSLGAVGTTSENAVSLQVNVQMNQLTDRKSVKRIVDLLKTYYNPKNQVQALDLLQIPAIRSPYIQNPSEGFLKKLFSVGYNPTPRELYDDYMYRQSLELLGHKDAWTMDIKTAQRTLLAYEGESAVVPRVVKMNRIRISSLLLLAFPHDPLSQRVVESRWARPMPAIEMREFNNDFDLVSKARWTLGLIRATEKFGAYEHDKLFSELTGVSEADIQRMRKGISAGKRIVRYVLQSPTETPLSASERAVLRVQNKDIIIIQLSPEKVGAIPLILQNNTVVWHRRNIHRTTLLGGESNPGLENALMQQALENKLVEALVFNKYAPNSFPETLPLTAVVPASETSIENTVNLLNQRFPQGWVLKGAYDLSSERVIVTDKIDFAKEIAAYENGFESFRQQIESQNRGEDPEAIIYKLKKHKGYLGSKILNLLKDKSLLLVQQRRQLVEEFRVEIQNGRVLGAKSTIPRYAYLRKNKKPVHPIFTKQAESFAQNVVNQLPTELKVLPYGFDVALTVQGDWVLIETNPGGNSSFLEENASSRNALNEYLKTYQAPSEGLLSLKNQSKWIEKHLKEFGLKAEKMYPGVNLGNGVFEDAVFSRTSERKDLLHITQGLLELKIPQSGSARALKCSELLQLRK